MAGAAFTPTAAALILLATFPALATCAAPEPSTTSTSGRLLDFGWWPSSRMRAPCTERPSLLPSLPADLPRRPTPNDAFRA